MSIYAIKHVRQPNIYIQCCSVHFRQASLAFRSLIDFSKYDVKDIPKLVPFPAPSASPPPATSSGSSDSSSYVSGTQCVTETVDSESIRSTVDQSVVTESDYEGVQVNVVTVNDDDTDSSKEEDIQYGQVHLIQQNLNI